MKTLLAVLLLSMSALSASAQDSRGRDRRPPSSGGGNQRGGSTGGSTGGSQTRGGGDRGGTWDRGGSDRPTYSGGENRNTGTVRRRNPVGGDLPSDQTVREMQGRGGSPDRRPQTDDGGNSLGRAVRRDSLPPSDIGGVDMGRHHGERGRGQYYWHHYNGYRYCHYVDGYGYDWYFWYSGDYYYEMQYHSGRWWRYDSRHGRWCYLHHGSWYWHDGSSVYVYDEGTGGYYDGGGSDAASTVRAPDLALTLSAGSFGLSGGSGDVLDANAEFLDFDGRRSLSGPTFGAELTKGINNQLEASVGAGYYRGSANSVYRDYVRENGSEIRQQLRLTQVPVTAALKIVPFGRDQRLQPYLGAGVQVNKWNYEESGEFIDFNSQNYDIYADKYKAGGVAAGPVLIAGLRVPLNDRVAIGGEYRRSWVQGSMPADGGFAADKIDLGGNTFQAGVTITLDKIKKK